MDALGTDVALSGDAADGMNFDVWCSVLPGSVWGDYYLAGASVLAAMLFVGVRLCGNPHDGACGTTGATGSAHSGVIHYGSGPPFRARPGSA